MTHSENHWSNRLTMVSYVESVLVPYFNTARRQLGLSPDQPCLLLCDVFAAHRTVEFRDKLQENNIKVIYIPAGCTGQLQPLDVAFNDVMKSMISSRFTNWYADEVADELKSGKIPAEVEVKLTMSRIKPIHANWLIDTLSVLATKHALIKSAFSRADIPPVPPQSSGTPAQSSGTPPQSSGTPAQSSGTPPQSPFDDSDSEMYHNPAFSISSEDEMFDNPGVMGVFSAEYREMTDDGDGILNRNLV